MIGTGTDHVMFLALSFLGEKAHLYAQQPKLDAQHDPEKVQAHAS
jgi:hypothetical protein